MTYLAKLKDPRWQKKRLECFQAAGWKCERCHSGTKPLNAHHRQYRPGREPWEYELGELVCLCEDCHAREHNKVSAGGVSSLTLDKQLARYEGIIGRLQHGSQATGYTVAEGDMDELLRACDKVHEIRAQLAKMRS
jgi:hypothetical protein